MLTNEITKETQQRIGKFTVRLASTGNPDHNQIRGRSLPGVPIKTCKVQTMQDASRICLEYIAEHDLGAGNWAGGQIKEVGQMVAKVSYNGRVWELETQATNATTAASPGITFKSSPSGTSFSAIAHFPQANKGKIEGMIYPPKKGSHDTWRICYGDCTEHAIRLRGKVSDKMTLEAAKAFLQDQFRHW